jgi:hypothetical protein
MQKRTMIFITAMVLLFAIVTGSTIAYMTSKSAPVINTFTYGNVVITLDEARVNTLGKPVNASGTVVDDVSKADRTTANTYRLYPGTSYTKDPTIHVDANSENCYLFVKVVNPISTIEASDNTIANQMKALGWSIVSGETNVYYYDGKKQGTNDTTVTVSKGENIVVFEKIKIDANAEVSSIGQNAQVKVVAYAIQAENFNTALEAWAAAPLTDWGI